MDAAGTNPPRNYIYSIVDKSWTCPTTAKKEIIHAVRCDRKELHLVKTGMGYGLLAWNIFLSAVKLVVKWLHIGIEWPKEINSDAFARRTVAPLHRILLIQQTV